MRDEMLAPALQRQVDDLQALGLDEEEARLVVTLRADRAHDGGGARPSRPPAARVVAGPSARGRSLPTMLAVAIGSAVLVHVVRLLAPDGDASRWVRDLPLLLLVPLGVWFVLVRAVAARVAGALAAAAAVLAVALNVFPFAAASATLGRASAGAAVALWFLVGVAHAGGDVRSLARRTDFVRFSGEWAIVLVLLALGGGVLVTIGGLVLAPIVPEAPDALWTWLVPSGAAGGVVVAAWLVESRRALTDGLAPVLTAVFTPLFAVLLLVETVFYAVAGVGRDFDRELLTVFDSLLVVVLALVLFGLSARRPAVRAGLLDALRTVAVVAALLLDALVLVSMRVQIGEFGFTANRVAALALNALLVVDLAVTAVQSVRLLRGRTGAGPLERWQVRWLPAFGVWGLALVLVLPPVFGFA